MADLSKIKVGDKLRIEVEVESIYPTFPDYPLRALVGTEKTLLRPQDIEAAEHIPAPRMTFKRGDWVTWNHGSPECIHRHCLFLKYAEVPHLALIDDAGKHYTVFLQHLEVGEAPE
jgi:hypothetical protein